MSAQPSEQTDAEILAEMSQVVELAYAAGIERGWWAGFRASVALTLIGLAVGGAAAWGWMP